MRPLLHACLLYACALLLLLPTSAHATGVVTLPLSQWRALLDEVAVSELPVQAPMPVLHVDRQVKGTFRKGVFSGTLDVTIQVLTDDPVRVPIIDASASIGQVVLDGQPTSLLQQGDMYNLGVQGRGQHTVVVAFLQGREDDRFARQLRLDLPPSGPTALSIVVPEQDIDAALEAGTLTGAVREGKGTRLTGHLDARGDLALSWQRRLAHGAAATETRAEARIDALFTLHEALVRGVAVVDLRVREGELDRVELVVPPEVEVVDVTGDAVLQWRTTAAEGDGDGSLVVLLRYLVDSSARIEVHFQLPVEVDETGAPAAVRLSLPHTAASIPVTGSLGVQGPAGMDATVAQVEGATELALRDLPPQLTELTDSPLLLGMAFEGPPEVTLALDRHGELELTSTIVDDVQASTVLLQDGSEITKLRLRLRNNTRQYLSATLPAGAVLTHALVDGQAIRPGLADTPDTLLLPLRQSERIGSDGARTHVVRPGDTLGGIAALHLGDASRWPDVHTANLHLLPSAWDLEPGMVLTIPDDGGTVRESAFVIELAWRLPGRGMGMAGRRGLSLATLDVDAVELTWHVYLPQAVTPIAWDANLTRRSAIQYDPLTRIKQFLSDAFWMRSAWAGSMRDANYESILSQRKTIYRAERGRLRGGQEVMSTFPYTGQQYRFSRILLGRDTPRVAVSWLDSDVLPPLRLFALIASFGLVLVAVRRRDAMGLGLLAGGTLALLVLGHHVLGIHRRILWGADLALAWTVVRTLGPALRAGLSQRLASPRSALDLLSWRNLAGGLSLAWGLLFLGAFPLLLSSVAFVLLGGLTLLSLRRA